jgi:hypothetical protein
MDTARHEGRESHKEITMDAKAIVVDNNNKERCFEILTWKPRNVSLISPFFGDYGGCYNAT